MKYSNNFYLACKNLIENCANISINEKVLIITDNTTKFIGDEIHILSSKITENTEHVTIQELKIHGEEPPKEVKSLMVKSDVIFALTSKSLAHSKATFESINNDARFLSLPDYSLAVIESPALQVNFKELTNISEKIAEILNKGEKISITTELGTDLICNIKGRISNPAPGWCYDKGVIASPPDSESNIALIEDGTSGILVVDGSIPCNEIGLLKSPVSLTFKDGKVIKIEGEKSETLKELFDKGNDSNFRIAAEFGIGLNPLAKLQGFMLEDEGTLGTFHIGIGSNIVLGGKNSVPFHLDHIVTKPTIFVDSLEIMKNGKLLI
jgi:leucyl aminopeptidase (aminopeptidase T)